MNADPFWDDLGPLLALYGPDALRAKNAVLLLLKSRVLAMWADAADEVPIDFEGLKSLTRRHITGEPS